MLAKDHSLGISPLSRGGWNKWANTGPSSTANSLKTLKWSSSCPNSYEWFKPFIILMTPSFETWMSLKDGADFSNRGTSLFKNLENTSVNWPLNPSACSVPDSAKPLPAPFERRDTLIVFPLTVGISIELFGVNLNVNQFVNIHGLFFYLFIFFLSFFLSDRMSCLSSWNFDLSLLLPVVFCICVSFIPFSRDGSYWSTYLRGKILIIN